MSNNVNKQKSDLSQTNVVYKFSCPKEDCKLLNNVHYVGMTSKTLSRRLTMHLNNGAPFQHYFKKHKEKINREVLVNNTKIIYKTSDINRLSIAEALLIKETAPLINVQFKSFDRTLKLFS